jgi:hypothetical protein
VRARGDAAGLALRFARRALEAGAESDLLQVASARGVVGEEALKVGERLREGEIGHGSGSPATGGTLGHAGGELPGHDLGGAHLRHPSVTDASVDMLRVATFRHPVLARACPFDQRIVLGGTQPMRLLTNGEQARAPHDEARHAALVAVEQLPAADTRRAFRDVDREPDLVDGASTDLKPARDILVVEAHTTGGAAPARQSLRFCYRVHVRDSFQSRTTAGAAQTAPGHFIQCSTGLRCVNRISIDTPIGRSSMRSRNLPWTRGERKDGAQTTGMNTPRIGTDSTHPERDSLHVYAAHLHNVELSVNPIHAILWER